MKSVSTEELHKKLSDPSTASIIIDVREPFEYKSGHIPGSENVPLETVAKAAKELQHHGTIYVSCGTGMRSQQACDILAKEGVPVVNVEGGLTAWKHDGFAVDGKGNAIPIIRQVLLIAGSVILLGLFLGTLVDQWWYLLSAVMAAGLCFAGATGICFLSQGLKCMPWNR